MKDTKGTKQTQKESEGSLKIRDWLIHYEKNLLTFSTVYTVRDTVCSIHQIHLRKRQHSRPILIESQGLKYEKRHPTLNLKGFLY